MPTFTFTHTYHDGNPLFEVDLDNLRNSIEEAVNVTQLDFQNFTANSVEASSFADSGIFAQPGSVTSHCNATAPTGWLNCDGSSQATATYPNLFTAIGYTYGGSGANFNLPNLQGYVAVGQGTMGGTSAAGLITAAVSALDTSVIGNEGGNEALPSHTHDGSLLTSDLSGSHAHTHSIQHAHTTTLTVYSANSASTNEYLDFATFPPYNAPTAGTIDRVAYTATTGASITAGTGSHSHPVGGTFDTNSNTSSISNGVVQPTIVLNKIIKF